MEKINILLVGAGALGFRYFEGLLKLPGAKSIDVIDLNLNALEKVRSVFNELHLKKDTEVVCYDHFQGLRLAYDVVVIATGSDVRFNVLKEISNKSEIKNLILEKVLFQKSIEFDKTTELIKDKGINTYVNHPRREFPFYQKLRLLLKNERIKSFSVSGPQWGLACNGLHFIDVFMFLSGKNIESLAIQSGAVASLVSDLAFMK